MGSAAPQSHRESCSRASQVVRPPARRLEKLQAVAVSREGTSDVLGVEGTEGVVDGAGGVDNRGPSQSSTGGAWPIGHGLPGHVN